MEGSSFPIILHPSDTRLAFSQPCGHRKRCKFCIPVSFDFFYFYFFLKNEHSGQDRQVERWHYEPSGDILYLVIGLCLDPLS